MPIRTRCCGSLARVLSLTLLACLAGMPAAQGQSMFDAEATAFVTIETPASATFTITTAFGTGVLTTFTSALSPATASAVELWAFDEHRIGLLPIVRKVWAKKGSRPQRIVETRYQWLYLYGFVHPQSGRTHCLTLPRRNAVLYSQALQDFAQAVGASVHKQIVLVVDGAGSHRSHEVVVPEHLHLLALPPYSPELQPAEKVWPLTNEPLVNKRFETLADLEAVQKARCATLASTPEVVRGPTLFHWWPRITK